MSELVVIGKINQPAQPLPIGVSGQDMGEGPVYLGTVLNRFGDAIPARLPVVTGGNPTPGDVIKIGQPLKLGAVGHQPHPDVQYSVEIADQDIEVGIEQRLSTPGNGHSLATQVFKSRHSSQ